MFFLLECLWIEIFFPISNLTARSPGVGRAPVGVGSASDARVSRDKLDESEEEEDEDEEEGSDDEEGPEVWGEDEDIDSDEALGEGDEARFEGFKFKGSRTTTEGVVCESGMRVEGSSSEEDDAEDSDASSNPDQSGASDDDDEEEENSESEEESDGEEAARRRAMSNLLAQEATSVKKAQSTAAQSEATKGKAIMQQQKAFDALLSARIKFQPALQSVNSLPAVVDAEEAAPAYAEALKLFNTITELRTNTLKR